MSIGAASFMIHPCSSLRVDSGLCLSLLRAGLLLVSGGVYMPSLRRAVKALRNRVALLKCMISSRLRITLQGQLITEARRCRRPECARGAKLCHCGSRCVRRGAAWHARRRKGLHGHARHAFGSGHGSASWREAPRCAPNACAGDGPSR